MRLKKENRPTGRPINRPIVKICGLRRREDAEAADLLRTDLAGFILSPGYRRSIDIEKAKTLRRILSPQIGTVGVFVDASYAEIVQAADAGCISMIQLHGSEDETFIRKITALTGLPVIKAFRIGGPEDLAAAAASSAPWVLLDSGSGTGRCFDWDLLDRFLKEQAAEHDGPLFPGGHQWILAGGLTADNVPAAIQRFHPDGVDVSSKVETGGWKDPAKMAAFLAAVRQSRV